MSYNTTPYINTPLMMLYLAKPMRVFYSCWYTTFFTCPQRKNLKGWGQAIALEISEQDYHVLSIDLELLVSCISCHYSIMSRASVMLIPHYLTQIRGRSSIITGKVRLKNRLYFRPLSLPSIKYGPTMWCPTIPHHTLTLHWRCCGEANAGFLQHRSECCVHLHSHDL